MNFIVSTYVMVELAEPGTEGITYELLTTASTWAVPSRRPSPTGS